MRVILSLIVLLLVFLSPFPKVIAQEIPDFPACPNSNGGVSLGSPIVKEDSGSHLIPGSQDTLMGSKSIWDLGGGNFLQCICPLPNGESGIKTEWRGNFNGAPPQGWTLISSGSPFGLSDKPYLFRNSSFVCSQPTVATPSPTPKSPSVGGSSSSGDSGGGSASAPTCNDPKPDKASLVVKRTSPNTVQLSWGKVTNATDYIISYGNKSGSYIYGVPSTGNVLEYTVGNLDDKASYCFTIRALNNCQPSDLSNEVCITSSQVSGVFQPTGQVLGISTLAQTAGLDSRLQMTLSMLIGAYLLNYGLYLKNTQKISKS